MLTKTVAAASATVDNARTATVSSVLMTLASAGLLCDVPAVCRRHQAKIGTYAHEVQRDTVSTLTGYGIESLDIGRHLQSGVFR